MKLSKNQIKRVVKDMKRALSLLELELEVRNGKPLSKPRSPNALRRSDVVSLFRRMGHPATVEMARLAMVKTGKSPSKVALNNHIHSALARGELVKLARGLYEAASAAEAAQ